MTDEGVPMGRGATPWSSLWLAMPNGLDEWAGWSEGMEAGCGRKPGVAISSAEKESSLGSRA